MHIVCLHRTQGHGVEGVHIWGIAEGFKSLGHTVSVVSPSGSHSTMPVPTQAKSPAPRQSWLSMLSRHMPEIVFEFAEIAYNLLAWRRLGQRASVQPVDFLYERYAIFACAGALFARRQGIPLLLEVNYTSQSPLVRKRSTLLLPLAKWVDAWLFRQATAIVVVSSVLRDQLMANFRVPPEKILVVPNAADPDKFHPFVEPLREISKVSLAGKNIVGFVGSFAPWHGLGLLLEAFRLVARDHPEALAILVGDGPQRSEIEKKAASYGLADRVLFTGPIGHDALMHCVAAFSVGVMPDSNDYGSPMKVFEYMALGKPVVVPDYGPLLDVITDGQEGRVFARQDAHHLAACISQYFSDPPAMLAAGRKARARVEAVHNWKGNAERSLRFALSLAPPRFDER